MMHRKASTHSQAGWARAAQARKQGEAQRRGFTLLEVIVAISMVSVVMGGAAVLLQGVWRVERSVRHHQVDLAGAFRLSESFRNDVHAAQPDKVSLARSATGTAKLVLTLPDERIVEYTAGAAQVERIARRGSEVLHRDTFLLKPESTVQWQLAAADNASQLISMLIAAPLGSEQLDMAEQRTLRIEAMPGMLSPHPIPSGQ
jgi:prepilin-type N-terminal cleavage/methylation domain-containing protein